MKANAVASTTRTLSRSILYHQRHLKDFSRVLDTYKPLTKRLQSSSSSSSSVWTDLPIPESVRERVKSSLLEEAARDDSRLWRRDDHQEEEYHLNGYSSNDIERNHANSGAGGVNDPIVRNSMLDTDSLQDLYLRHPTRYWPHLPSLVRHPSADPFALAQNELVNMSASIRSALIGTDHPVLNKAASYFFESNTTSGKQVRPMMVLLLSRALAEHCAANSSIATTSVSHQQLFSSPFSWQRPDLPAAQRRLAEISEMMHTASLFHDDVIDDADTRRGIPALHVAFGSNKMAILAGDYLLARASICLARLRNVAVVETMSTIIEHLVRGEVMQMKGTSPKANEDDSEEEKRTNSRLEYYLRKNFYKTGSLMAHSCKSAALLGEYSMELVDASYRYGKHVGMAFQLVDDVLDFEGSFRQLGKPALADLKAGLATAPVLFAAEEFQEELEPLMNRKFKHEGDVERAVELIHRSHGMERTKELARVHAERAMDSILELHPSEHRDSLLNLAYKVVARTT